MTDAKDRFRDPLTIAFVFCFLKVLIYVLVGSNYGYFRDELYFLACADHPAWGYPDHAPLSIYLTWFSRAFFGDSLYAIHLFPTIAGVLKIILTGLIVRELSGRHIAMLLACLCVWVAPVYLAVDTLMSMNAYEPIFWMGCVLSYIWAIKREDPRYWLMFGGFAGLGLMNKHSMVFFGVAFIVGLLLTGDRKVFASGWIWLAAVLAFILFLPNLIWQYENNWATLELLRSVQTSGKNVALSPPEFIWQQAFILLPLTVPVWLAGIWYLTFDGDGKRFRTLGITYLILLVLMIALKAKNYYLVPIYPALFAAGGVFWEHLLERLRFGKFVAIAYGVIVFTVGLIFLPMAVPLLPVETFIRYQNATGIEPPKTEVGFDSQLPQHFSDRFGWEEMTAQVANVYNSMPPEEREKAAIFGNNYGEAGAIDFFGHKYGLPKAISGHQSYFVWGPRNYDGSVLIILGDSKEDVEKKCANVEERERVGHQYAMGYEHFNILICRGLKVPLPELWPKLKFWN